MGRCSLGCPNEATKAIRGITGLEVIDKTATVDHNTGKITNYKSSTKFVFGIER